MADNYLGRKMEEYAARPSAERTLHKPQATLRNLLLKSRGIGTYDPNFTVRPDQLERIIAACDPLPTLCKDQVLRFTPVTAQEAPKVLSHIYSNATPTEQRQSTTCPNAFIIIRSTIEESRLVDLDAGIATQCMRLQAAEIGLNANCITAFDSDAIGREFALADQPLLILAIGREVR